VNPLGDCIDVGFGLDRLCMVLGEPPPSRGDALRQTVLRLLESGFRPSNKRQGYELRRLLRRMVRDGIELDHEVWRSERDRQLRVRERYERLRRKHPDRPPEWWWDTHGIDVEMD
jgi:alanyl-tRNA synthetase